MQTTQITEDTPVGAIAAAAPLATRVFARHGIDFCCGGGVALAKACESKSVAVSTVLAEIETELAERADTQKSWNEAPLPELIDHILAVYHRPLDEELPRIDAMAAKVLAVHGERDERLAQIRSTFASLKAELEPHMMKEEQILFPMIRQGSGAMAQGPVHVMSQEHDEAGAMLRKLRELTEDYVAPDGACNTWRALWSALADLERSLHEHIHLENNVLFPRALATGS